MPNEMPMKEDLQGYLLPNELLEEDELKLKGIADDFLQMSDAEIATMSDRALACAITCAKLILAGQEGDVKKLMESCEGNVKDPLFLLLDGKIPSQPKDLLRFTPEQLLGFPDVSPLERKAAELAKLWMAGDAMNVYEACDSIPIIDAIGVIVQDAAPEKAKMFKNMLAAKRKEFIPTPDQHVQLWLAGEKQKAWQGVVTCDQYDEFAARLKQADPDGKTGTLYDYLKELNPNAFATPGDELESKAAELSELWLAGDAMKVYEACDSINVIDLTFAALEKEAPEKAKMFKNMLAAKRTELMPAS